MKRYFLFCITCIAFFTSFCQTKTKLAINFPDYFEYFPLFKKKQLVETIDSFLSVRHDPEKWSKFWETKDIDQWGHPGEFMILGDDKWQPLFLDAIDLIPKSKYLVKLAYISRNDTSRKTNLYSVYNFIANYNHSSDKFTFERYSTLFTQNWFTKKVGNITYYKEKKKEFNKNEAKACNKFNNEIAKFFNLPPKEITFYSCRNPIQFFNLKGYDYVGEMFYARTGGTIGYGGLNSPVRYVVYSGINREIYKHEISHFYINHFLDSATCMFANEGIATYLGGGSEVPLEYHLKALYHYAKSNPDFKVEDVLWNEKKITDTVSTFYAAGGLFAKLIYEKKGLEGLKQFLTIPCREMFKILPELLGVRREDINAYVLSELKKIDEQN